MQNALQTDGPPPAPQDGEPPQQTNPLQGGAGPQAMAQGQPQQQAQQPPAPSHAETVAALRHFGAITSELEALLKNPKLGRADLKSEAIDGVTKLVSERILSPAQAVLQLTSFPSDPLKQRGWLQEHLKGAQQGEIAVLHYHGQRGPVPNEPGYDPDDHQKHMDGLMSHFRGR